MTDSTRDDPTHHDQTHDATIDWHRFWTDAEGDHRESARPGETHGMADLLDRLFERTKYPDSFAAVGCGPADCPLELAERHPDLDVFAYDATESARREARERAADHDLPNVTIEEATLPAFDPDRSFDAVYCYAVLHYVEEAARAVRNLYDAVAPGGLLVFNYPNRFTRAEWDRESTGDGVLADRPDFRERFQLLLEGRNLLSYDRIEAELGARPRSFWSAADAEEYWSREETPPEVRTGLTDAAINPCVCVPK
ncbi:class I SAM-dependent methyltransferase [Halorussus salinus]|uniref:class I SAM-dependent methyltransferase n=1 Tax=Halorussus salinus TaxID=1364935 RepID=UPI0010932664|nr:class I SAM-dependent methyltransferase [Halorussus salinus]